MKTHHIYIAGGILALILSLPTSAQNNDSITVISSRSTKTDTTSYVTPKTFTPRTPRPDNFWRRVSVGGWTSFQFGSITAISVSPEVKVRTVDNLYPGIGLIYQYSLYKDWIVDPATQDYLDISSNIIGGRVFLRYYLSGLFDNFLQNFFLHTEYEYLYYVSKSEKYSDFVSEINSIFVGGGYKQPISDRAFFDFLVLFNLNDTPESPYTNPVLRFGFGIGL